MTRVTPRRSARCGGTGQSRRGHASRQGDGGGARSVSVVHCKEQWMNTMDVFEGPRQNNENNNRKTMREQ
jgi:hypothetical protein